jgi:DNA-binding MarR family transcriptional regulator
MPNEIWDQKLRPIEFAIFSYLCYYQSHDLPDQITLQMIANGVHSTVSTVKKYIASLVSKGLITSKWSPAASLQCNSCKNFFTLPNEIFLLKLPPPAFMVYAYLLLIEDRKTHTCHPSYNTIAAETSLSKNTALKSIDILLEAGLITVEPSSYFDRHGMKWKGNNLYTILPINSAMDTFHQRQLRKLEIDAAKSRLAAQSAV